MAFHRQGETDGGLLHGDRGQADSGLRGSPPAQMQDLVRADGGTVDGVGPLAVDDGDLHVRRMQRGQRHRQQPVTAVDEDVGVAVQGQRRHDHVDQLVAGHGRRTIKPCRGRHTLDAIADVADRTQRQ